ncbi:unnamed protein product [Rotaria socialis]|uniref:Uncharacterized protein n=2 Tax=Rotaria socialis TaxID=392032 RepID=A0A820AQ77_9BILA|nr:unnamed protein product [Rotaria socialis]CAF3635912.1 unnamed protein product [Rotaria socialis]CAF3714898.1 unnamed protein product [Rotaria socialis]CAF3741069.1 unnamed protein product [Rotaria socialis]CAF4150480.1 unnamed protein product [Rotaria socialis]
MDFDDDFDFINNDMECVSSNNDHQKDILDFPLFHSTPSLARSKQPMRPVDFPSIQKHYGIVTFFDRQMPIIYRLINNSFYIPYIHFCYVLNIFEHPSYKNCFVDIRNLPVIEMTTTEKVYYDELSSLNNCSDWSNYQLLSVSVLDGVLSIVNLTKNLNFKTSNQAIELGNEWQETLNRIRKEARDRWMLDEKIVLTRVTEKENTDSTCIVSTNMAQRRSIFEERLDHLIIDEAGGFVQIDSFIYPFIKNRANNQLYINLDDIRQNFMLPTTDMVSYSDRNSPMYHTYSVVLEQAQSNYEWNVIRRGPNHDLSKVLSFAKKMSEKLNEEIPFLPLEILLHLFLNKNSNVNLRFVQLFETSSLNEIDLNYKNNVGRQFITGIKRQGGLVNGNIPCLIFSQFDRRIVWIPSETKTDRIMTNDERLYLNMILIYHGCWKDILTKKKQWFLKEIDRNDKENINIQLFFATG